MNYLIKLRKFILLDTKTKLLLLEAFIYLGWARVLILFPFSQFSSSLGIHMQETPYTLLESNKYLLMKVSSAIEVMSHHTLWESKCLVRAIAALKMLERRRIGSTLYLGTTKDHQGKLIAHAWLRSGTIYVTGAEEMKRFTTVGKFAKII